MFVAVSHFHTNMIFTGKAGKAGKAVKTGKAGKADKADKADKVRQLTVLSTQLDNGGNELSLVRIWRLG